MKKLPICTLVAGALFVLIGTIALVQLTPGPEPFSLLFPLAWDLAMVGIGLGIVFRCECARKAGVAWSIFCILATLAVGGATFFWTARQSDAALGRDRLIFLGVTIAFGVLFGLWQWMVLRSQAAQEWTRSREQPQPHVKHT
jgi:hypothetical protein